MKDYKGIHETFRQRDYDYRAGWREEAEGKGIAIGAMLVAAIIIIGVLA